MNTFRPIRSLTMLAAFVAMTAAALAASDPNSTNEKELIGKLRSDAPAAEKAVTCKLLAVHGTKDAVPELAKLLTNEQLASWARIALEAIPGPESNEALRQAIDSVQGRLLVGTINSIGVKRDEMAVEPLSARLKDANADVASAAAVALGHVANDAATKALRGSLANSPPKVRSAVAEGCILCAERLMNEGKTDEAVQIYDEVRKAEVPKQRILEATRGAILARRAAGIALLLEQLQSKDLGLLRVGLSAARELPGKEVADALVAEVSKADPQRAALLLTAFADRGDAAVTPAVLAVAKDGSKEVRVAAIAVIGRLGDAASLPALLEIANENDAELSQSAKTALAEFNGANVNAEIAARLDKAEGKTLPALIELVGQRRIEATPALVRALGNSDAAVRNVALAALGATVAPKDLSVLISQVVSPKNSGDLPAARKALRAACVRMPDREACAAQVVAAMSQASVATKSSLLEILGEMGGSKALDALAAAVKGNVAELQDTGSRALGEWMELDAAPVLLDLSKTAPGDKYQVRALRGYIRLARQFAKSDEQRAQMCQTALDASARPAEQKVVLTVLQSYPSREGLKIAMKSRELPELKEDATRATLVIVQKLGKKAGDVRGLLSQIGMDPVKVEIIKAEYGAGSQQKDVTEALKRQVGELPLIALPSTSYSTSFGGDPVPGTPKQLKVKYRINGKPGEASFPEDAIVMLPMP